MNYNKTRINDNTDAGKRVLCQLKETGMSCFGCCGNSFTNEKAVMRGIHKNSVLLKHMIKKHKSDFGKIFSDMKKNYHHLRECGICYSLINLRDLPGIEKFFKIFPKKLVEKDRIFGCPMHPILNNGKEIRKCEIWHECKSYHIFKKWSRKKQDKFIDFLKKKIKKEKLSIYQYSVGLDTGKFISEFLKAQKQ